MTTQDKAGFQLKIRELHFNDGPTIALLSERLGMGKLDLPSWRNTWEAYPFAAEFQTIPAGWVMEDSEGRVQGYLGNFQQLYEIGGVRLKAASSGGWMIDEAYRGKALQLVITFYKQKGIDLFINSSANQSTIKVMAAFKIPRIPLPDYATPCFWAVRPQAFARAVLRRKAVPGAAACSWLAGPAIGLWDYSRGSGRGRQSVAVDRCNEFGPRFDDLWLRLSAAVPRLRAIRTAAVLQWKFKADLAAGNAVVLVAGPQSQPTGYAVLLRRDASELGMEMYEIVDIQAVGDDPEVFTSLLLASIEETSRQGADAIKIQTGTPAKRRPVDALRPYSYKLPFWQLYCKIAPLVCADLSRADAWDLSRFDTF